MLNIPQEGRYRLSLLQYAERHSIGPTKST